MRFFNLDNRFWQLMFFTIDIVLLGILWILLSLTVVGFGPACTALYYAMAKSIRRERGRPFHEFFHALKQNWWKSMILGLILVLISVGLMAMDFPTLMEPLFSGTVTDELALFWAVVRLVVLLTVSMHIFPVISRFQVTVPKAALLSFLLSLRHLGKTVVLSLVFLILFVITYFFPVLTLFAPGLFTYFHTFREERILKQYILDAGIDISGEKDPWYME